MKNMNKKWVYVTAIFIGISIVINVGLYLQNQSLTMLIKNYKASEKLYIEERTIMNELIPKINPTFTKEQLAITIKAIKPGERVDVLEDLIGWRFYHFWFSKDGRIAEVIYGS
jgi:hypothetical protein